jgi:hypothetical protein
MKGPIVKCLEEAVSKHGADKWKTTLAKAGIPNAFFGTLDDVDDKVVLDLVHAAASVLGIPVAAAMEAFGEHWSFTYAPSIYGVYFDKAKSARELLLNLASIHVKMTANMKNAAPPQFTYDDSSPDTLVMTYSSKRGMVALMPGLVRGVGKYYKEQLDVVLEGNHVKVQFRSAASRRAA